MISALAFGDLTTEDLFCIAGEGKVCGSHLARLQIDPSVRID